MSKPVADPRPFLEDILERNRQFYSDPRGLGALKDLQQTFPNPWLYVTELLQNAVDEFNETWFNSPSNRIREIRRPLKSGHCENAL